MDELDLLKKDWNKQTEHKTLSVKDIYPMLHKKSSSIVKMLFYISIAELIFWILISTIPYYTSDEFRTKLDKVYTNDYILNGLNIFSFSIIAVFIYLLYKSYKSISVTDSAKKLMESILKTRKIIKYYVLYNLIMVGLSLIIGLYYGLSNDPKISNIANLNTAKIFIISIVVIVFIAIVILLIWLFYRLLYGLLLKRLNRNYNELKKLEV
ncbi:hypothetical protein A8C32_17280 [Flavivirga aquatica]|uniref:Beta-carotene 15,15'-monooxygenase n=1 Tax=Flavivirga aquatica TaxID=1849968 RepID=A0A1E5T842_9FLAO|nr:hypothetical protein [Flavivirga aquatica]OEK07549.1 hypothetical protein A8C32_17280 [Flavivirga aquatica]